MAPLETVASIHSIIVAGHHPWATPQLALAGYACLALPLGVPLTCLAIGHMTELIYRLDSWRFLDHLTDDYCQVVKLTGFLKVSVEIPNAFPTI